MSRSSRFRVPTEPLALGGLLKQARRGLWLGFGFAVAVHLVLSLVRGLEEEDKAAKPLTTHFVKRQPRLSKPLELKKRPAPKRRAPKRRIVAARAKAPPKEAPLGLRGARLLEVLGGPQGTPSRPVLFGASQIEVRVLAQSLQGSKEAEGVLDMSLALLDVDALDTGKYYALVIQHPDDKRSIRGFLHLACAYPRAGWNAGDPRVQNELRRWPDILGALVKAMNRFTDIRTDLYGKFTFDSGLLFKLPFLYNRLYWPCELVDAEARNLGRYLMHGGFLYAETVTPGTHSSLPGENTIKLMIKSSLETQRKHFGRDWVFDRLPNEHALYHCYFDFNGPPVGTGYNVQYARIDYLEGVTLGGRLLAIVSQKNYAHPWADWARSNNKRDNTRQLQFGVNLIVFALTQEGSITSLVMDLVAH